MNESKPSFLTRGSAWVAAVFLSFLIGLWGLNVLFSDVMLGYPEWMYYAYVLACHLLPSICVGLLLPRRWFVGALGAWGAVFIGGVALLNQVRGFSDPSHRSEERRGGN